MVNFDFRPYYYSPEVLARKVLELYFEGKEPSFPIDPFKILDNFNVIYQFRDFKELEGIYLFPENEADKAIVGINVNRPIYRQRFTAAHEICHHIKDKDNTYCEIVKKSPIEAFADSFASELLMPEYKLKTIIEPYLKGGFIEFDDILKVSYYFGTSFQSCVFSIAYKLKKIKGDTSPKKLNSRIRKFKPEEQKKRFSIPNNDIRHLRNVLDGYRYFWNTESKVVWYKFKNDFVYNENRMEGIELDYEVVAEILADIRIKK